jgi:hypothetical protein
MTMQPECQQRIATEMWGYLIHPQLFSILQHCLQHNFSPWLCRYIVGPPARERQMVVVKQRFSHLPTTCILRDSQQLHFITYFKKSTLLLEGVPPSPPIISFHITSVLQHWDRGFESHLGMDVCVFVLCAFFLFLHSLKWDSQPT